MSAEALYVSGYAAIMHRVKRCSCVTRLSPPSTQRGYQPQDARLACAHGDIKICWNDSAGKTA